MVLRFLILVASMGLGGCLETREPEPLSLWESRLFIRESAPTVHLDDLQLKAHETGQWELDMDPFDWSHVVEPATSTLAQPSAFFGPDQNRKKAYLESFELTSLTLVGILKRSQRHVGIIRTPDHELVNVVVGDYLGRNDGQLISF